MSHRSMINERDARYDLLMREARAEWRCLWWAALAVAIASLPVLAMTLF